MSEADIVKKALHVVLCERPLDLENAARFFHEDYVQHVDGKTLNRKEFLQHLLHLDRLIETCSLKFETLISEGDAVFSNHRVFIDLKNGDKAESHVLAEFSVRDSKICYCDELTRTSEQYGDLGSAR